MSYKTFKKEMDKKREEQEIINSLNNTMAMLEKRRNEYAEKAKQELKKGNKPQYNAYVSLLKNAMFNLTQTQNMLANYTIARDLREMQSLNQKFVRALNSVMQDVYKTSKSINVASSERLFLKALDKQNYTAVELQKLLQDNNMAFAGSITSISEISDDDVRAVLENEIKKDEADFEDTLSKLEAEFSVGGSKGKPARTAEEQRPSAMGGPSGGNPGGAPVKPTRPAAPANRGGAQVPPPAEQTAPRAEQNTPPAEGTTPKNANGAKEGGDTGDGFEVSGAAFRPQRLADYMGQPEVVATITDPIKKARLLGKPLPHVLLCGSYGQGKTTLANIIANELGGNFIKVSSKIAKNDLIHVLRDLKKGDVVFIDEVHQVSADNVETVLYSAMEDFELTITEKNGGRTVNKTVKIQPFTLIGATTETGKLLKPFYSKFPINLTLREYKPEVIAAIVKNSFRVNGMRISDGLALDIARRSRLSPRQANAHVEGIVSTAIVQEAEKRGITDRGALSTPAAVKKLNIEIGPDIVKEYFEKTGVDEMGLGEEHRKILEVIIKMYRGGPVGQENIAKALNMATNRIDQEYEPYLVKLGFLNVRPQGRFVTDAAYKYLGYPVDGSAPGDTNGEDAPANAEEPAAPQDTNNGNNDNAGNGNNNDIDEESLPVIECEPGAFDGDAAQKIYKLFSGEGTPVEQPLDELFPGVDKTYDSAAKNRCLLKVGQRELYCDSKLERRFLAYLFKFGFIKDAKSEAVELEYSSAAMSGKTYYPDFVLSLYDGRIAVVEMKNLTTMGYHLNIDKYARLKEWCTQNGYLYAEVAMDESTGKYVSAEQIAALPINEELKKAVKEAVEQNGFCTAADIAEVNYTPSELIGLLLNDRTLKNIDRTGNNPNITEA